MMDLFPLMILGMSASLVVFSLVLLSYYRPRLVHVRGQFRLQTLLLSFVVVWSSLAAFGMWGIVPAAILLAIAAYVRSAESIGRAFVFVCLLLLCGTCLIGLFLPAVQNPREASRIARCLNQIKQLELSLHNYHSQYKCFPPAYVAGPDGKPMHSWRVLILSYIERKSLYDRYDFDEPWDGPNNSKLATPMPDAFRCPNSEDWNSMTANETDYVAVVGPETAWPGAKPATIDDIPDGTSKTIMLVEVANSGINWMEPKDVSFDQAHRSIDPASTPGVSPRHVLRNDYFYHDRPVFNIGFVDGSVDMLPADISPENFASLLTRDGGEEIDDIRTLWPHFTKKLRWPRIIALIVLALSYAILLFRPRQKSP